MAILRSQPKIEVTIDSNGTKFTEYGNDNDEVDGPSTENTVVRYIETAPDVSFSVHIVSYIDGTCIGFSPGCFRYDIRKEDWSDNQRYYETMDETGHVCRRTFKFKEIETVEDTSPSRIKLDKQRMSKMGVIEVRVFRREKGTRALMPVTRNLEVKDMTVAEKATKGSGISHGFVFGEVTRSREPAPSIMYSSYKDGEDKPLAVFIFKYRSKSVLQSMDLVPRTPSPDLYDLLTPEERERKIRDILAKERDSQRDIKPSIKSENARIKHERGFEDGEMIDLTHPAKVIKRNQSQASKEIFDLTDD